MLEFLSLLLPFLFFGFSAVVPLLWQRTDKAKAFLSRRRDRLEGKLGPCQQRGMLRPPPAVETVEDRKPVRARLLLCPYPENIELKELELEGPQWSAKAAPPALFPLPVFASTLQALRVEQFRGPPDPLT